MRLAYKAHAFVSRYAARGVLAHAANFAGGVVIGSTIVLFFWLMVG